MLAIVTQETGLLGSTQHQGAGTAAGLSHMAVTGHKHVVRCFASIPQGMHACMRQLAAAHQAASLPWILLGHILITC